MRTPGAEAQARYVERHPERAKAAGDAYREKNREREAERSAKWAAENPEGVKAASRAHYQANKEKRAAQTRAWREANPEKHRRIQRNSQLKRKYGITLEDYEQALAEQGGTCAICNCEPEENKNLHVDHCHATSRIRGLLCGHCNKGLGLFRDHPDNLERAAAYLRS